MTSPGAVELGAVRIAEPGDHDVVVAVSHSAISTGTEKLLWSGDMPDFPGMGYPLVPGYEATGLVLEAGSATGLRVGERVFVPGSSSYLDARGLFGAAARHIVTDAARVLPIDAGMGATGALLALAATAYHTVTLSDAPPDLVVGHGTLGRLVARVAIAIGAAPPLVWDTAEARRSGAAGYDVVHPDEDARRDLSRIIDASGDAQVLDALIGRIRRGGEITLGGFYAERVGFAFPPAFMREAKIGIAAEWTPADLAATRDLIDAGALSLDGLITHSAPAGQAPEAYLRAFQDPDCLKMTLDWTERA